MYLHTPYNIIIFIGFRCYFLSCIKLLISQIIFYRKKLYFLHVIHFIWFMKTWLQHYHRITVMKKNIHFEFNFLRSNIQVLSSRIISNIFYSKINYSTIPKCNKVRFEQNIEKNYEFSLSPQSVKFEKKKQQNANRR